MTSCTIKRLLLTGTALIAVSGVSLHTAHAAELTLGANGTFASTGGATGADIDNAAAGDTVDVNTYTLTITDGATSDDGGADNTYAVGAITDTDTGAAGTGGVTVTSTTGQNDVDADIVSVDVAGTVAVTGVNGDSLSLDVDITNDATIGGALLVTTNEAATADTVALDVGGALSVTGNTVITAGDVAGANASVGVVGNTTFSSGVSVNGGGAANADATLTLSGASNAFDGGLTLTNNTGSATLVLDGAVAQTVSGAVSGDGDITVTNTHASGVTFTGANTGSGTITVNNNGNDQAVTFTNSLSSALVLGGGVTADTVSATFGSSTATTISGDISGGAGNDTVGLTFTGGSTVTLSGAATSNIDTLTVSGNTTLDSDAAITATTINVGNGSTLDQGLGVITADIVNAGTLHQTGAGTINGDISGSGTLDVDASAIYNGNVAASAADIAAGQTLTVNSGDYTVTTTTLNDATAGLQITAGTNITGDIVGAQDGYGAVTVASAAATTAISGDLGSSSASLATLDVASLATVTTDGDIYVDAIGVNDLATLSFIGTSAQTVSGTVNDGQINIANAQGVTFNGALTSIASITAAAGARADFDASATTTGALDNAGTIAVGQGAVLTAASYSDNGGVFILDVNDSNESIAAGDYGALDLGGATTLDSDDVTINVTGVVGSGDVDVLVNGGDAFDENKLLVDNSALYTFTAQTDGTITSARVSTQSLAETEANGAVANALIDIGASASGELDQIVTNFVTASTNAQANDVLEASASDTSGGGAMAGQSVAQQTAAVTNARLALIRSGYTPTGFGTGDMVRGLRFWGQGFGASATQDEREGIAGYDASTYGFTAGVDAEVSYNNIWGLALSYAKSQVDGDDQNATQTDVDALQLTAYTNYDFDGSTYFAGQLGYAMLQNDTARHNVGGTSGLTATGTYDASQITARAEVGRSYLAGNAIFTPMLFSNYVHYNADDYTETGAGTANLNVSSDAMNLLEFGAAFDLSQTFAYMDGSLIEPSIRLGVRHDVIGDQFESTNSFIGGGNSFTVTGFEPAQTTWSASLGLTYFATNNWEFSGRYDYEFKEDYASHAGLLKGAYKF